MKCNSTLKDIPKITRGNDFILMIELKENVLVGHEQTQENVIDGTLVISTSNIKVTNELGQEMAQSTYYTPYVNTEDKTVSLTFNETLPKGSYGVEIKGTIDNKDFRWYAPPTKCFIIVESTHEAYVPPERIMTYHVTANTGLGVNADLSGFVTNLDLSNALGGKVDKANGKGLSTNDFDNTYKGKLDDIDSTPTANSQKLVKSGGVKSAIEDATQSVGYAVCSTAAATAAKTVSLSGYTLRTGGSLHIKMNNANTASNVTLKIGDAVAKNLFYNGSQASASNTWEAGEVLSIYYDGTQYQATNAQGGGGSGDGAYDISVNHPTGGNPTEFATLQAALTVLNSSAPSSVKKGGMTIKFIDSNTDKYVQYVLKATDFSNDPTDWSYEGLAEEIAGYDVDFTDTSIVKSRYIDSSGDWTTNNYSACYIVPINEKDIIEVTASSQNAYIAFLDEDNTPIIVSDNKVTTIGIGGSIRTQAPTGSKYLYINKKTTSNTNHTPQSVRIYSSNESLRKSINTLGNKVKTIEYATVAPTLSDYLVTGKYISNGAVTDGGSMYVIPINGEEVVNVSTGTQNAYIGFATSYPNNFEIVEGSLINGNSSEEIIIPEGTGVVVINKTTTSSTDHTPLSFTFSIKKDIQVNNDITRIEGKVDSIISQEEDALFEKAVNFNLSPYLRDIAMKNVDDAVVWSAGSKYDCYLVPVTENDVFFVKARVVSSTNVAIWYAFLSDNETSGQSPNFVTGTGLMSYNNPSEFLKIDIPEGARWLCIDKRIGNNTDHTPAEILHVNIGDEINVGLLQKGTFNSSYNEIDTTEVREKFCSLIKGKGDIETFLFFSDPHLTDYSRYEDIDEFIRDKYISTLQKYYNSLPLDFCICGGDWLNFSHTNEEACAFLGYCDAYMRKLFRNYLPVMGNHDMNPYPNGEDATADDGTNSLPYTTIRNLMFRENGGTYYSHKGINSTFYVLNSGISYAKGMTSNSYSALVENRWIQIDWLASKLIEDDAAHSIIISHIYSNAGNESEWFSTTGTKGIHSLSENVKNLCIAYNNRSSITLNGTTYDFSSCQGKVAVYLTGHTHFDYVDTSNDLPIVCITNLEGGHLVSNNVVYDLVPTFDNCLVDYSNGNNKLYAIRVGVGVSRIVNLTVKTVSVGSTLSLSSEIPGTITWQSRDGDIATVDSDGVVTGVSAGNVGIIASSDGWEDYYLIKVSSDNS